MAQYIDKSALVAEIERRISNHNKELQHATDEDFVSSWASDEESQKLALTALIPFLNTIEVKEIGNNLWHPADGNDLPEIDREVIALLEDGMVVFAHRPPEYWDGRNIITNKVTRYVPKTYEKGGWNQPNVKWWLDLELPKMGE
jgi:hypothetical protein